MRWLLIALLAGCTTSNPKYMKGDLGTADGPGKDGSTSTNSDAASPTPDGAMATSCAAGSRSCDPKGSEACTDGTYVPDRTCPEGSACTGGYCAEPAGAPTCTTGNFTSEALCGTQMGGMQTSQLACQPFVQGGALVWACAPPVGNGGDDQKCTTGETCRSGVCASNGYCFRPCAMSVDCGKQGPAQTCSDLTITVEGVSVMMQGCVS